MSTQEEEEKHRPRPTVDLGYPTPAHGSIPAFPSIEEEAEFWDTHSFVDYLDDFEPVPSSSKSVPPGPMSVRLDLADRVELTRIAGEKGVGSSTLVRMWIKERLDQERKAS